MTRKHLTRKALKALKARARWEIRQQRHRYRFIERLVGQSFALVVVLASLGVALVARLHASTSAGVTLAGATLVALVSLFLRGRRAPAAKDAAPSEPPPPRADQDSDRHG